MARKSIGQRIEEGKKVLEGLGTNPLLLDLQDEWGRMKSGIGKDIHTYLKHAKEAEAIMFENPDILDEFQITINFDQNDKGDYVGRDYDKYAGKEFELNPVDTILYLIANPWKLIMRVVSEENLNRTKQGGRFRRFYPFQKAFLRDCLDPRVKNLGHTAGRGCAKTFLVAVGIYCGIYLMPSLHIMILSGGEDQAQALYRYFAYIAKNTQLEEMLVDGVKKKRTETIVGGFIEAVPSSSKKVQSPRLDWLVCDEMCEIDETLIDLGLGALSASKRRKLLELGTPNKMVHVYHDDYKEAMRQAEMSPMELEKVSPEMRWKWYELDMYKCPWIPRVNIDFYEQRYGRNSHMWKIMVMGKFAPAEGLVFDGELTDLSIIDKLPETVTIQLEDEFGKKWEETLPPDLHEFSLGVDVGLKHPTVVVKACQDQNGMVYIILDEEPVKTQEEIANCVYKNSVMHVGTRTFYDSGPIGSFIGRQLQAKLFTVGRSLTSIAFNKYKREMITNCQGLFQMGKVKILRKECCNLLNELKEYSYEDKPESDMPQKGNDDHVDAFLLACWGQRRVLLNELRGHDTDGKLYNMEEHLEDTGYNTVFETVKV